MPYINTNSFSAVATTVLNNYWYDRTKYNLTITNNGSYPLTVKVSDALKVIYPGTSFTFSEEFKSFTVKAKQKSVAFSVTTEEIISDIIDLEADNVNKVNQTEFNVIKTTEFTKNLFNFDTRTIKKYVAYNTGLIEDNESYSVSDWIPVEGDTDYTVSVDSPYAEYSAPDESAFVFGQQPSDYDITFKTKPSTRYIRISPLRMYEARFQLEKGTVRTGFTRYGERTVINALTKWHGLKWDQIGDSITHQNTWQPYVATALNLTSMNYGVAGTKVADTTGSDTTAMCSDERISLLDPNASIISFMGGTNDWAQNVTIGTIASTDDAEFYGALKALAEKLITIFFNDRIVWMTPPFGLLPNHAGWSDTTGLTNNQGLSVGDYAKAIKDVAWLYGIPVIDIYGESGICNINKDKFLKDETGDFLHPNKFGGQRIAELVLNKFRLLEPVT